MIENIDQFDINRAIVKLIELANNILVNPRVGKLKKEGIEAAMEYILSGQCPIHVFVLDSKSGTHRILKFLRVEIDKVSSTDTIQIKRAIDSDVINCSFKWGILPEHSHEHRDISQGVGNVITNRLGNGKMVDMNQLRCNHPYSLSITASIVAILQAIMQAYVYAHPITVPRTENWSNTNQLPDSVLFEYALELRHFLNFWSMCLFSAVGKFNPLKFSEHLG